MKSLGIYWRSEYGNKKVEYPFFSETPVIEYKRLFLRNSGNDFGHTHLKDASISNIIKDFAFVESQNYQPCVLYLNNEYWGIYNIRDNITPHHFKYHYGVDDDLVDLLEGSELNPVADDGYIDDFMTDIISFIQQNDLSIKVNFDIISERIEIDSYIDYIITQTYIGNTDWPVNNSKWWKEKTSEDHKKWKWQVKDTDFGFKMNTLDVVWIGDLYGSPYDEEKKDGFFIFNNLIKCEEFSTKFLNRYMFFIDTVFEKERVKNIINSNRGQIESEYPNHQKKWHTVSEKQWNKQIDELIEFNNRRNDKMKGIINNLINESK